jgi:hypothetical protein
MPHAIRLPEPPVQLVPSRENEAHHLFITVQRHQQLAVVATAIR